MQIYGFHPVREALRHRPHEVQSVWLARARKDPRSRQILDLCRRHRVEVLAASREMLEGLGEVVHNGCIAELSGVSRAVTSFADPQLQVLIEDVQDPRNLGALLRVCEGAGVGGVRIRDRGSAPLSNVALKTSAGAAELLEVQRITNSAQEIRELQDQGYWVYGADAEGELIWEVDLCGPILLCIGGEEKGLRQRTRQLCDRLVSLPMRGQVSSLNVATAAAALLYEAVRQRMSQNASQPLQEEGA
ncbi:MAG: 23S rRNA (guanosine(2251)-2'-O)-methyltransferase RlmB [Deltaproteobacteria bacterium]|nr:23S rRNA (guanosine(2251)-2'-O)-methyltransferase RlmB [Deltaproteobacteria bacterium]